MRCHRRQSHGKKRGRLNLSSRYVSVFSAELEANGNLASVNAGNRRRCSGGTGSSSSGPAAPSSAPSPRSPTGEAPCGSIGGSILALFADGIVKRR
jgi:hypothetical protein